MTHWNLSAVSEALVNTCFVTFAQQMLFFAVAYGCKFDKVTDFAYGTNFAVLSLFTLFYYNNYYVRQVLITVCVCLWAIRLAGYLLTRIIAIGKDKRFDAIRSKFLPFLGFWLFQFVVVWTLHLPVTVLNATPNDADLEARDVVGLLMFVIGMILETVADAQKFHFKRNPQTASKWTDIGLWKWSRHPNYFGELLIWWGIFVSCAAVFEDHEYWAIVGPFLLTIVLLFLTGIPPLETSYDKRYGQSAAYWAYKERTSPLIPLPPALYRSLPSFSKAMCCCEFPFYTSRIAVHTQLADDGSHERGHTASESTTSSGDVPTSASSSSSSVPTSSSTESSGSSTDSSPV